MSKSRKSKAACVYCGSSQELTVEHVVPLSRWREVGVHRRILDNESNRVPACLKCNAEKGAMLPQEWFQLHPEYRSRFVQEARYISNIVKQIAGVAGR